MSRFVRGDLGWVPFVSELIKNLLEAWQNTCRENNSNYGWNVGISCSKYIMDSNWEIPKSYPW